MSISIATTEAYAELTAKGFTIVDFYSTTCVPCKMLSRILEDLVLDYPFLNIVKVNITDNPKLGVDHQIEAVDGGDRRTGKGHREIADAHQGSGIGGAHAAARSNRACRARPRTVEDTTVITTAMPGNTAPHQATRR